MDESQLIRRLTKRLFDRPIIQNSARGELVEEIVAMALEPEWQPCGEDWGSHDLERPSDGLRIQVKQSAARQSWHDANSKPSRGGYSIATKTGRWAASGEWIVEASRNAEIFVFAWHPLIDASADHRNADQWQFYILAETHLPDQRQIARSALQRLTNPVAYCELAEKVAAIAGGIAVTK